MFIIKQVFQFLLFIFEIKLSYLNTLTLKVGGFLIKIEMLKEFFIYKFKTFNFN